MEIYTATLIIQKHLNWQNDKRNLPKVNEEKLKEAINLVNTQIELVFEARRDAEYIIKVRQ